MNIYNKNSSFSSHEYLFKLYTLIYKQYTLLDIHNENFIIRIFRRNLSPSMKSFFVETFQFIGILLYSANFQRTDWTDTGNLTRSLQIIYKLNLFVISPMTVTQDHSQARIVLI